MVELLAPDPAPRTYTVKERGERLLQGLAIGEAVATGKVCRLRRAADIGKFQDGAILVTSMTDPDWVPIMKRAAAIVTDHGGRTSHAAIVSRELGLPALVGTGNATEVLRDGREITVSCAEGDAGFVYDGIAQVEVRELALEAIPATRTKVMLNLANPTAAFRDAHAHGRKVGLCGQAPSDRPRFARFLVEAGIDSISVTPDSFIRVKEHVAQAEAGTTHTV